MAKDPAFLFYPGNWMTGTLLMTRAQKGAYMDLLIAQFNNGHLSLEAIKVVLGKDFRKMWDSVLSKKFIQDEEGLFYNEKLEKEKKRREKYVESRKRI